MEKTCDDELGEKVKETFLALADGMAASAVMFHSHGYEEFIRSRKKFIDSLHSYVEFGNLPDFV